MFVEIGADVAVLKLVDCCVGDLDLVEMGLSWKVTRMWAQGSNLDVPPSRTAGSTTCPRCVGVWCGDEKRVWGGKGLWTWVFWHMGVDGHGVFWDPVFWVKPGCVPRKAHSAVVAQRLRERVGCGRQAHSPPSPPSRHQAGSWQLDLGRLWGGQGNLDVNEGSSKLAKSGDLASLELQTFLAAAEMGDPSWWSRWSKHALWHPNQIGLEGRAQVQSTCTVARWQPFWHALGQGGEELTLSLLSQANAQISKQGLNLSRS